ncbi:MAG: hypothetical protein ABI863_08580 [Ginsengibacter sp.]
MKNIFTVLIVFSSPCLGQSNHISTITSSYQASRFLKDTSMTGVYDAAHKVMHIEGKISGTVTIQNAIIEANPYIQIADTTVTFINCKTKEFSSAWYGAKSTNADNSVQLQKCINTCIKNGIKNLYIADNYSYSQTLKAFNISNGQYIGWALNIYGDGDRWDDRQTLHYTGSGIAFGVQLAKGGSISKLTIKGNYKPPKNTGPVYYNTPFPVKPGNSGIVIDYDGSKNTGGSTGFFIEDTDVDGFDVLYDISPNGATYNADIIHLNNIHCGNGRIGVRSGQAQEKDNEINGIFSWGSIQVLIQIGKSGKVQAGNYVVRGGNVAGGCVQLFDISLSGWNSFHVYGLYAESIARIGTIYARTDLYNPTAGLNGLEVKFQTPDNAGAQTLFTGNSYKIIFRDCDMWYYDGKKGNPMTWAGNFTFDNVDFGGGVWNNPGLINIKHDNSGANTSIHSQ